MLSRAVFVMAFAALSPLGVVAVALNVSLVAVLIGWFGPRGWKQSFSLGPMGISHFARKRPSKPHGIFSLVSSRQQSQLSRWEEWAQSLPRSPRTTLLKQITKAWTRSPFTIRTHQRVALSSEIFQVIYRHQRRYYGTLQAALVAWSRCLVLGLMDGTLDQVRRTKDQRLVAICQTIVKGKVVRIQWFYQDEEASRSLLWFTFLAINVQRGIQMGCRFIDAGPSLYNDAVQLKEKFAFSSTTSWRDHYDGPFKDAISCCDLKMGSTFPPCTHNPTTIHQNTGTSEITNRPLQDPTSAEENCLKICKQLSHPRRRHTRQKQT
eukprot:gene11067-3134_t